MAKTIEIDEYITVGALADKLMIPVSELIAELMKNGVFATVNESLDFDTAHIIASELGLDIDLTKKSAAASKPIREKPKAQAGEGQARPPVVAVMGHVDHGKTSLLDAIRGADVVKAEAGGITQHLSAYQITRDKRSITFLDTPGHEAFAALREHGAHLTDVVIIVVAADEGIKPQTKEAIRFAQKAGVKIIVAINKIDKDGADANRVKQQLAEAGLLVEGWGGDIVCVEVSAKTKEGIDKLLDMVLLVADVEELKAVTNKAATGLIIESHMEKGRGPIAIVLVEEGTLKDNDFVVAGTTYAKLKALEDTLGKAITSAGPSTPARLTGFKELPEFGDEFNVVASEKLAKLQAEKASLARRESAGKTDLTSSDLIRIINRSNELTELPVLVKADVQGSLRSVIDSIKSLDNEEVAVRIVGSGIGAITENDVHLAHTSGAIIYGFNVNIASNIKRLAARDQVSIRLFNIIYELIDDAKQSLSKLLTPEVVEHSLSELLVKGIFKVTKTELIAGGEVIKGKLTFPAMARIKRDKKVVAQAELVNLQKGQQSAKEVIEGELCGISLRTKSKVDLKEGDHIDFYTSETVARKL